MQAWLLLIGAIIFEVAGTTLMRVSDSFTKLLPSLLMFACYGLSFACLTLTLKSITMSIAYAVWAGAGTALIAAIGFVYFMEPVSLVKVVCIGLIIAGVVGLNLVSATH